MGEVAIVGFAQRQMRRSAGGPTCVDLVVPAFAEVFSQTGFTREDIGFWCSGSSDYLAGRSFSFVQAVDAIGAYPAVNESHVEMDAAWALYEAWVKLLTGEVDTALVFGFGQASAGMLRRVLSLQLDPYTLTPLWPDTVSVAALQARIGLDRGLFRERDLAEVALRSRADAANNPSAVVAGDPGDDVESLLAQPMFADPLRRHDCAAVSDGAAVVVLATGERARAAAAHSGRRPAWITGIAHRIDPQSLGLRDLADVPSARLAAGCLDLNDLDVAELHAPFTHQELLLRRALGLGDGVRVNPSGGALTGNPMFCSGLIRIGEAAERVRDGLCDKALGHATSGPALQQNLLAVLEAKR